jgi:hypothetical protein
VLLHTTVSYMGVVLVRLVHQQQQGAAGRQPELHQDPPPHERRCPLLLRLPRPHPDRFESQLNYSSFVTSASTIKVFTNKNSERRPVVLVDRSPFKLFTLRISKKSVRSSSCERPKTTQRTLFLLFENNYCIPISA